MPSWLGGHVSEVNLYRNVGPDPFNQNFRNFCPKLNGSVWSNRKRLRFKKTGPPQKTFPGRTGPNFGWIDRDHYILGCNNVATGCINGIFFDENLCDSVRKKSNWL